jgi:hypothetical protein
MASAALLEAVAVTAELCGRTFSDGAARVFVADIEGYPEHQLLGALKRCRKEVRGALTVHDVVSRLEDGRPGPEEAWAMLPMNEGATVVWTDEMREAFSVASPLIAAGEIVAARMAFKETYGRLVNAAREAAVVTSWTPSLGHDPRGREQALLQAVEKGRLRLEEARHLCPALPAPSEAVMRLLA